ncbi:MAG: hypothetical protein U9N63_11665 [Pseudomonadota bacterium]|nr:hypothetical protein [Pseudomonadota bacterium]
MEEFNRLQIIDLPKKRINRGHPPIISEIIFKYSVAVTGFRFSLGLSVSAPFVWRCLNSRGMTEFTYPPLFSFFQA